eukprot:236836_1
MSKKSSFVEYNANEDDDMSNTGLISSNYDPTDRGEEDDQKKLPIINYLTIPIDNPSPTRGDKIKLAFTIHSPTLLHNKFNEPIIALNGASCTQNDWNDFITELSTNRCVITTDYRGLGSSKMYYKQKEINSNQNIEFTMMDLAKDIGMLTIHLFNKNPMKISLLGCAFGGRVAQCFAMTYPQYLLNLYLLGTSPKAKPIIRRNTTDRKVKRRTNLYDQFLFMTGGDIQKWGKGKLNAFIANWKQQNRPKNIMKAQRKAVAVNDMIPYLKKINNYSKIYGFKIYILHGDKDPLSSLKEHGMILHNALENSKLYILYGEGHMFPLTATGLKQSVEIINQCSKLKSSKL